MKIFGKLWKQFKSVFQMFLFFLSFGESLEIFGSKCLKIIGKFPEVIRNVPNGSQELKGFGVGFKKSSKGPE